MTQKQQLVVISLWLFTIGASGYAFNWFVRSTDCQAKERDISRVSDNQDDLLLNYGLFRAVNLPSFKLSDLEILIEKKEKNVRHLIEDYKDKCRSKTHKNTLFSLLKGFGFYLTAKEKLLGERQDFTWHKNLCPKEFESCFY